MNRRAFAKTLSGALVACALDFGFLTRIVGEARFKFKVDVVKVPKLEADFPPTDAMEWRAFIYQYPIGHKDGDGYDGCYQKCFIAETNIMDEEQVRELAQRVILERKYELGEPGGVEGAASTPLII